MQLGCCAAPSQTQVGSTAHKSRFHQVMAAQGMRVLTLRNGPEHLAQYGHSRDYWADRRKSSWPWRRIPRAFRCTFRFCAETAMTPIRFKGCLHTLRRRFGIKAATFVFDGGMSSQINLEAMSAARLGYVTRLSAATLRGLVAELDLEKQLELGDRQSSWKSPTNPSAMSSPEARGVSNGIKRAANVGSTKPKRS